MLPKFVRKWFRKTGIVPPEPVSRRTAGDRARDVQDWRGAATAYADHVAETPDDVAIWIQLGHARKESGDRAGADAAYARALELDPDDAELLLIYGHLKQARGELSEAVALFWKSFEIDHNQPAGRALEDPAFQDMIGDLEVGTAAPSPTLATITPVDLRSLTTGNVDSVDAWTISGWAIDPEIAPRPAEVDFFVDGKKVGSTTATQFRHEIKLLGLGHPLAGFKTTLDIDFGLGDTATISARNARTGQELGNSPIVTQVPQAYRGWLKRKAETKGELLDLVRTHMNGTAHGRLSIVMPVYNTKAKWLREAIGSVLDQWYDDWELICVDDCSPDAHVREILDEYAAADARVRPIYLETNGGIAIATNRGIAEASGALIGFMDHDDYLEPDAAFRMIEASALGAGLIYSDEALMTDSIHAIRAIAARPAFSHDYYLSNPYFVHFICVRTELARELGGLDETMPISADVDFVLRVIEHCSAVTHVPAVLYRWRTDTASTGFRKASEVTKATLGALDRHLKRLGYDAKATTGFIFNNHKIEFKDDGGKVLVVIPTKNRHDLLKVCIESVQRTTVGANIEILVIDHESNDPASIAYLDSIRDQVRIVPYVGVFNYARMNNHAVFGASDAYDYVLFLNNDIEAIEDGWLERLRSLCARAEVGVAGATLLYGNRTIQHAGVVMGLGDLVDHANKFLPFEQNGVRFGGYNVSLQSLRDYSAVTGACMMMRRDLFVGVGGFDETLEVGFNDTDLCLRIGALGYKILNDPYVVLYHHESATRATTNQIDHPEDGKRLARRWGGFLRRGDPFYNPLLTPRPGIDHSLYSLANTYHPARTIAIGKPPLAPETMRPDRLTGAVE